jgi:hypothetical protein
MVAYVNLNVSVIRKPPMEFGNRMIAAAHCGAAGRYALTIPSAAAVVFLGVKPLPNASIV